MKEMQDLIDNFTARIMSKCIDIGESLDGDQVDNITERVRIELNLANGNITRGEYIQLKNALKKG